MGSLKKIKINGKDSSEYISTRSSKETQKTSQYSAAKFKNIFVVLWSVFNKIRILDFRDKLFQVKQSDFVVDYIAWINSLY